jgi:hypothetical protein
LIAAVFGSRKRLGLIAIFAVVKPWGARAFQKDLILEGSGLLSK